MQTVASDLSEQVSCTDKSAMLLTISPMITFVIMMRSDLDLHLFQRSCAECEGALRQRQVCTSDDAGEV